MGVGVCVGVAVAVGVAVGMGIGDGSHVAIDARECEIVVVSYVMSLYSGDTIIL